MNNVYHVCSECLNNWTKTESKHFHHFSGSKDLPYLFLLMLQWQIKSIIAYCSVKSIEAVEFNGSLM